MPVRCPCCVPYKLLETHSCGPKINNNWNLEGKKSEIDSHGKHMFTQSHNQFI